LHRQQTEKDKQNVDVDVATPGKIPADAHGNKITHLKESLKQNYYRSKFENCRNDVKKNWKVIYEIISTNTKKAK